MSPPIRSRGPWKAQKRSSESDRWLDELGFFRKHTARDASCLFRAVSENIYNTQRYFHKVRLDCVQFMASEQHLFEGSLNCPFENYLKEMSNPSEWGGLIEISAMSHLYRRDFVIFEANKGPQIKISNGYGETIYLFYSPETKHFDAVYTKEFIDVSSFCQWNITRKQGLKRKIKDDAVPIENIRNKSTLRMESLVKSQELCCYNYYPHLDYVNYQPLPVSASVDGLVVVEIQALPLMVDCRPAGAPPHEIAHPSNGAPPENHQNQQAGGSGDMVTLAAAPPSSVRASTPASTNVVTTYSANYNGAMNPAPPPPPAMGVGYGCAPYACGVKGLVWCAPHAPPPPPPGVNPHVYKSVQPGGADLPMNDIATLRYYFNLGVECMWAAYGAPPHAPAPPHLPPHAHAPPRHYSPRDIAQDMQQMSLHEARAAEHKHKPQDKPPLVQPKGQGQRPLLGPRFKRGNNQDGNQNNNHNQNKGHNNNPLNKGPNNRRNSHTDMRAPHFVPGAGMVGGVGGVGGVVGGVGGVGGVVGGGEECALEAPLVTFPYIPYPPPIYPLPYYPIDSDPAMMGMMGGMGYVSYDEGVEYAPVQHFYPPPFPPPHHPDHK